MGVSKNRGTPKWVVYSGKPYQNGGFGGNTIFGNIPIVDAAPVNWFIPTVDTTHRFVLLLNVQKSG